MYREKVIDLIRHKKALAFEQSARNIFKNVPHFPAKAVAVLAKVIPWLAALGAVVSGVMGVQHILAGVGIRRLDILQGPDSYWLIIGFLEVIAAYISALSFPLLRERKHLGWQLLFWSSILSTVMSLIGLLYGITSVFGFIIVTALAFYITFEMEPAYTVSGKSSKKTSK